MTSPKRPKGKSSSKVKLTSREIVFCFVALLVLAAFIAYRGFDSSAAWGFLAVAVGLLFGRVLR